MRNFSCSFCGAEKSSDTKIVAGPLVGICDRCVRNCAAVVGLTLPHVPVRDDELEALLQKTQATDVGPLVARLVDELRGLRAMKR